MTLRLLGPQSQLSPVPELGSFTASDDRRRWVTCIRIFCGHVPISHRSFTFCTWSSLSPSGNAARPAPPLQAVPLALSSTSRLSRIPVQHPEPHLGGQARALPNPGQSGGSAAASRGTHGCPRGPTPIVIPEILTPSRLWARGGGDHEGEDGGGYDTRLNMRLSQRQGVVACTAGRRAGGCSHTP